MQIVKVFPDYCSSGLWDKDTGANLDENSFIGVLDASTLMALKYWHQSWEDNVCYMNNTCNKSTRWQKQWEKDGVSLVERMNLQTRGMYEFIYIGDNF